MRDWLARPDHLRLTKEGFDLMDWDSIRDLLRSFPELFHMWASKHMSHFCGVGRSMKLWGFWDHDHCLCCNTPNETTLHLLICSHNLMSMNFIDTWMRANETHPNIRDCIHKALLEHRANASFSNHSSPFCLEAAQQQDIIGWQNFVEGKISCK